MSSICCNASESRPTPGEGPWSCDDCHRPTRVTELGDEGFAYLQDGDVHPVRIVGLHRPHQPASYVPTSFVVFDPTNPNAGGATENVVTVHATAEGAWGDARELSVYPLHAHVSYATRDCDGLYTGDHVTTKLDGELDHDFEGRVLRDMVSLAGFGGSLEVVTATEREDEWGDITARLSWSERTDEGHRHVDVAICRGDCELDAPGSRRDHSAELAGY